ncbi:nitrate reductase [Planosporangium flavigriseum]|uniref:Pyrimidine permease RutG n=1 Tax=Planosporangium flavigriseum TaxID=373681 RepID=A0A8J3PJC9_9ACTN|nr:solute carrier family 23 protein [Planosporangium flavigriseum]NJC63470.1 nitrate reductase [Planosporangium flavigriseum]GIG72166.1 pyrimidine permease RutG [Planosporangium flavigriseum]
MIDWNWRLHGDGRQIRPGEVVAPEERLSWPRTIGIGAQHVLAMFGATFLVPLITGFPPATTLFFSGIGTILFLLITRNRVPSYLGSSFAFIAPVAAASAAHGKATALGGIVVAGALFAIVGLIVHKAGIGWIEWLMPPVVTGAIVALIGFNLAPVAKSNFVKQPATALVTLVVILLVTVAFRGILGRLSILVGVLAGYLTAALQGQLDFTAVRQAAWVGLPDFTAPRFNLGVVVLFVPVVLVLIAENVGHVKAVASMTGRSLDHMLGRTFIGDGVATMVAGAGGGSGTTTYAENIGVMAATRVYSTAVYWVAGVVALLLGLSPKFGALINTIPPGVLGGATVVLYGLIGVLGARIWVQARVDFANPANLMTAAVALIIGIADFSWKIGNLLFNGIALGSVAAIVVYHVMRQIGVRRGTVAAVGTLPEPAQPAAAATGKRTQARRRRP